MMYPLYLKEREGLDVLETECGFAIYKFRGPDCYIQDIYVLPAHRKAGVAASLADKIAEKAKATGIRILTGSVNDLTNGAEASHKVLLAYGMRPYTKEGPMTFYMKEI